MTVALEEGGLVSQMYGPGFPTGEPAFTDSERCWTVSLLLHTYYDVRTLIVHMRSPAYKNLEIRSVNL